MKPTGKRVAKEAVNAVPIGYTYDELDCQAFIEHCVKQSGGQMAYRGSNDMVRNAAWLGTLENAKAEGKLVLGAGLLIHEDDESGLPDRYKGDGMGDFSHVGFYVGENALTDTDKSGRRRTCNVVHSSRSMGRVAGSTVKNGWTHVMLFKEIDYGMAIKEGVSLGVESMVDDSQPMAAMEPAAQAPSRAQVTSPNHGSVKMRAKPSKQNRLYWSVPYGATVEVLGDAGGGWFKIRYAGRTGYMMTEFLLFSDEINPMG